MGKILVVDDEPKNLKLMEALLTPLGHQLLFAQDGQEALDKAKSDHPDLILLDIQMPILNGFEAAKLLKDGKETSNIPIVMVTAFNAAEDRVKALQVGADDFLAKPVDKTELRARVTTLLKVKAFNDYMLNYQKTLESEVAEKTADLRKAFDQIKSASLETIFRLSRAAEYKDEDTGAHIQRMSKYSEAVAKKMGLSDIEMEYLLYAAPMHDIGKIGIPDRILLKPGKLDDEEWVIMRQHPVFGANILEGSDAEFVKQGALIALSHHERWDGSGYPNNLKGEEIPLSARIAAIADVFDALTSNRPYRKEPFTIEKSFSIIEEGIGSHFDPAVAQAFFSIKDEILNIKKNYKDEHASLFLQVVGFEKSD
jgi:putative two-component system response regulator